MGATSEQGWCLFVLMVGFVLGPAGLYALGWPVGLVGFALMATALWRFHAIKEPQKNALSLVTGKRAAPGLGSQP
jgi:hypothetical protein